MSMPGTEQQKRFLLNCNGCHTFERIVKSNICAEDLLQVFRRMTTYAPGSIPPGRKRLSGTCSATASAAATEEVGEWWRR